MEVHHHSHTPRKKWHHYFWEFLMLFLAVTLGFLVENEREHYVEHLRARQYARSLTDDLKSDTLAFRSLTNNYKRDIDKVSQFRKILQENSLREIASGTFYYYCEPAIWVNGITFHDATIQQLKNSGNLRYFSNNLQYMISEYDRKTREILARLENEVYFSRVTREMMTGIFDSENIILVRSLNTSAEIEAFKQKNISFNRDTLLIRKLVNEIIYRHASWQFRFKEIIEPASIAAIELLAQIRNEYHVE